MPIEDTILKNHQVTDPSGFMEARGMGRSLGARASRRLSGVGARTTNVFPGQDIQRAIDRLNFIGGGTVYLMAGTHTLTESLVGYSKVSISGEGRDQTIIECSGAARGITYAGVAATIKNNFVLKDFTLQNSNNAAGVDIDYCDFWRMENVRITSCDQVGIRAQHCQNFQFSNCRADVNTGNGFDFLGDANRVQKYYSLLNCLSDSNSGIGYDFNDSGANHQDYEIISCIASSNTGDGFNFDGTTSLDAKSALMGCTSDSNGGIGYDASPNDIEFIACEATGNTGDGFEIDGLACTLIACASSGNGVEYDINNQCTIIGSVIQHGSGNDPSAEYTEIDTHAISIGNIGGSTVTEKRVITMRNVSGGTLAIGDVVILASAANGQDVTTTTTTGNDKVFGMALGTISNNNYGQFLIEGKTASLKVDGTTDIAIGDFLGCFTTAKIAMKAAAGDQAFAIALEAYTTNDSLGVIDALIIQPRAIQ